MDRRTFEEIRETLGRIESLRVHLDKLLTDNELRGLTDDIQQSLPRIEESARQKTEREFAAALARVNFQDRGYTLLRVIDGDTLEVLPPKELLDWMRDVHIRLYGVDSPESNTELGPIYTEILRKLCELNEGHLYVVWERERKGTEYAGFPTGSFERGIANVFVEIAEGNMLYVNAVIASLPDAQIARGKKQLIRAARHTRNLRLEAWRHHCFFPPRNGPRMFLDFLMQQSAEAIRYELQLWRWHHGFPVWVLPKELLNPLVNSDWPVELHRVIFYLLERCDCSFCRTIADSVKSEFPRLLEKESATPFDLFLLVAYASSHSASEEA